MDLEYQYWGAKMKKAGSKEVGKILDNAPENVRGNKNIVKVAVQKSGTALKYATPSLQNDKQVVMIAVQNDGYAIQFASPALQKDKDAALAAVRQHPDNIRVVHEDLKRDPDILIAAGMYDEDHVDGAVARQATHTAKIVLSTRFSLDPSSGSEATNFTALFKKSKFYIQEGDFAVYAPNAFDKKTCDPEWTRFDWPCRGTIDTCQYTNILTDEGHPTNDCCWRYSFRSQLQEAKDTGGFMLQLVETGKKFLIGKVDNATLGMGQIIELDMANTMKLKVFQVYRPEDVFGCEWLFEEHHIDSITATISQWYKNRRQDMSVTIIRQPRFS